MTLEELWELFPIVLTEHNDAWAEWAADETACLRNILGTISARYHHIGSTAINGIASKPIVDIIVEVETTEVFSEIKERLIGAGYILMSESDCRMSFNKGYTPAGYAARVFHIHVRTTGDTDETCFRDYLNRHEDTAKEYESLKLSLCKEYKHNRDGYTQAKSSFVNHYTSIAKQALKTTRPDTPAQL